MSIWILDHVYFNDISSILKKSNYLSYLTTYSQIAYNVSKWGQFLKYYHVYIKNGILLSYVKRFYKYKQKEISFHS